jgi:hypothetical protein
LAECRIGMTPRCRCCRVLPLFLSRRRPVLDLAAGDIDHELGELSGIAWALGGLDIGLPEMTDQPEKVQPKNCTSADTPDDVGPIPSVPAEFDGIEPEDEGEDRYRENLDRLCCRRHCLIMPGSPIHF